MQRFHGILDKKCVNLSILCRFPIGKLAPSHGRAPPLFLNVDFSEGLGHFGARSCAEMSKTVLSFSTLRRWRRGEWGRGVKVQTGNVLFSADCMALNVQNDDFERGLFKFLNSLCSTAPKWAAPIRDIRCRIYAPFCWPTLMRQILKIGLGGHFQSQIRQFVNFESRLRDFVGDFPRLSAIFRRLPFSKPISHRFSRPTPRFFRDFPRLSGHFPFENRSMNDFQSRSDIKNRDTIVIQC